MRLKRLPFAVLLPITHTDKLKRSAFLRISQRRLELAASQLLSESGLR